MKKITAIAAIMIFFLTNTNAQNKEEFPRITFGAEWSFVASAFTAYHFNYFSPEGYRYNEMGSHAGFTGNGEGLLHVGYNVTERWNLSIYTGITGISNIHNAIPLSIRATHLFNADENGDRWFAFADAGTGISLKKDIQETATLKLGTGYRVSLSRDTKLDFHISLRCIYTHPDIYFENELISYRWINRNNALVAAVSVGMAVTF